MSAHRSIVGFVGIPAPYSNRAPKTGHAGAKVRPGGWARVLLERLRRFPLPAVFLATIAAALAFTASPALADTAPTVTIKAPTGATATTVHVSGTVNPNGGPSATVWGFQYSKDPATEGWAGAGGVTVSGEYAVGSPESLSLLPLAVAGTIEGLQPDSTYQVRLVAANAGGESASAEPNPTVVTLASAPTVDSQSESAVTPFEATLEAQVNPNNEETKYHLEYATSEAKLGTAEATTFAYGIVGPQVYGDQRVGLPGPVTGLTPNTTYYWRVVAENATGEVDGTVAHPVESFTTLTALKPVVTGERLVGAVLGISDTIEAQLNPEYQNISACGGGHPVCEEGSVLTGSRCAVQSVTKTVFEATGFTQGVELTGCEPLPPAPEYNDYGNPGFGHGGSPVPFTATLSGLQENTAYEYRIVASNATGTFEGAPQALLRMSPHITGAPVVSEITQHTALITPSTIDPEIEAPLEATYYILYGTGEARELLSARTSVGSGLVPNPVVPVGLYGLAPGTTYHYAVVAYNGNATTTGPQQTFTTAPAEPPTPPAVVSQSAQFVNENSAVIEGEVNPGGGETTYAVQYGTSTAYGSSVPGPVAIAPATSAQGTITALTGLAPGTTYHYRIVATNAAGTGYGPDATFPTTGAARTAAFTPFSVPTTPQIAIVPFTFPKEPGPPIPPKPLTNKQKLAKALTACKHQPKRKRAACRRQAKRTYR
jgi:hypothetical protein